MKRVNSLVLNLLLLALALPGVGKAGDETVVFSSDFSGDEVPSQINPMHETRWSVEDGVLMGKPATAEQQQKNKEAGPGHFGHNAKMFVESKFDDAVVDFRFRFDEDDCTVVFVGNAPGRSHLFNLNLGTEEASLMRFRDKKRKDDENEILAKVPVRLRARKWHTVKVVMQGPTVTVSVDGEQILAVSHDRFAGSKYNPTFRTAGPAVLQLDDVVIREL